MDGKQLLEELAAVLLPCARGNNYPNVLGGGRGILAAIAAVSVVLSAPAKESQNKNGINHLGISRAFLK